MCGLWTTQCRQEKKRGERERESFTVCTMQVEGDVISVCVVWNPFFFAAAAVKLCMAFSYLLAGLLGYLCLLWADCKKAWFGNWRIGNYVNFPTFFPLFFLLCASHDNNGDDGDDCLERCPISLEFMHFPSHHGYALLLRHPLVFVSSFLA